MTGRSQSSVAVVVTVAVAVVVQCAKQRYFASASPAFVAALAAAFACSAAPSLEDVT